MSTSSAMSWKVTVADGNWALNAVYNADTALTGKYGNVTLTAQWSEAVPETPATAPAISFCVWGCLILLVLLGLGWWLLLLFRRRYVRYSLLDGGIRLSYSDGDYDSSVEVYLRDDDDNERLLGTSPVVPAGEKLKLINGVYVVLGVEKGFYKGRLHVTYYDAEGREPKDIKVRIHAKRKEYNAEEKETER